MTTCTVTTSHTKDGTAILRRHPSNAKVSPFAGQRQYLPAFLSYFMTLSIGLALEIETTTSLYTVEALVTVLILPRLKQ